MIAGSSIFIFGILLFFAGCHKNNPGPSAETLLTNRLAKTWVVDGSLGVSVDGYSKTTDYPSFQFVITGDKKYSTSGAQSPGPWPVAGTWSFASRITDSNVSTFQIIRNDGLVMNVTLGSGNKMKLNFIFDTNTNTGGRIERVTGQWEFNLKMN